MFVVLFCVGVLFCLLCCVCDVCLVFVLLPCADVLCLVCMCLDWSVCLGSVGLMFVVFFVCLWC